MFEITKSTCLTFSGWKQGKERKERQRGVLKNREIQDESMVLHPQLGKAVLSEASGCLNRDLLVKSYSSKFLIKQSNQPWTQVLQWHNSYTSLLICFTWTPNASLLNTSSCWITGWHRLSWSFSRSFFSPTGLGIKKGKESLSGYAPGIHSSVHGDKVSEREK